MWLWQLYLLTYNALPDKYKHSCIWQKQCMVYCFRKPSVLPIYLLMNWSQVQLLLLHFTDLYCHCGVVLEVSTWWVRTHLACTFVTPSDFLRLCYHPGKLPSVLPIYLRCDYGTLTLTNLTYSSTCNVYNHLSKV